MSVLAMAMAAASFFYQPVLHAQPDTESEEEAALLTLLQLMETDIATKTVTLDPDFSPGIVVVLRGSDLAARGIRNVGEALSLIPGVHLPATPFSELPLIRGVGGKFTEGSGKLKVMLNGVSFNNSLASGSRALHRVPIAVVERIEFIRGPGSSVYGEYAYSGVVNVLTKQTNGVYVEGDSFSGIGGGASINHVSGDLDLSLLFGASETDGDDIVSGPDIVGTTFAQPEFSNAPGPVNRSSENTTVVGSLQYRDLELKLQFLDAGFGDGFGVQDALPGPSTRTAATDEYLLLEGTQSFELNPATELRVRLGWQTYDNIFDRVEGLPPGALGFPDGTVASSSYTEDRFYGGIELESSRFADQTWLLGVDYADVSTSDVAVESNLAPFPFDPGYDNRDRTILGVYLQDYVEAGDHWTFTIGVRADGYSDTDSAINPRLAAVYRYDERHAVKAQFARAFRPPNFVELYNSTFLLTGNPDAEPETIQTLEVSYIFKTAQTVARVTAFDSDLDDLITREQVLGPAGPETRVTNSGGADVWGLELELERQFSPLWKIDASASWVDTEDRTTGKPLPGSAELLASAAVVYQPAEHLAIALQTVYTGERERQVLDPRRDLDDQTVVGLTVNWFDAFVEDLTLRAGISNLLDEDVFDPAPAFTYPLDYPGEGSRFWVRVAKEFKPWK